MKILKVYSALVLSLAFVFTPALMPLRAQAPGGKSASGFGGGDRFLNGRGPAIERLMSELTDDQKASLREAMVAQRQKTNGLEVKLREARRALFDAGLAEKFNEEEVRKQAMATAKLEAELTVGRMKAFSQMRPPLSAEQIEKLRNSAGPGTSANSQPARKRNRPELKRDENGLPSKEVSK